MKLTLRYLNEWQNTSYQLVKYGQFLSHLSNQIPYGQLTIDLTQIWIKFESLQFMNEP